MLEQVALLTMVLCSVLLGESKLNRPLRQIEGRLKEEAATNPAEPNSLTFLRAVGARPSRWVSTRTQVKPSTLRFEQCLKQAFEINSGILQAREAILATGGSRLVANSRFLPSLTIINQYEQERDFSAADKYDDSLSTGVQLTQRLLEYGKDHPIDVDLREEQRNALFNYENQVAQTFSQVRRAFYFVELKGRQIATRRQLLEQFERQHQKKQQRLDAGNLSVKFEVLTARLNVLNEQTRINELERQQFNRKMELLRSIGMPVGADRVDLKGQPDSFALADFDIEGMIALALAQSSDVALAQALVSEQKRTLDQLKFESMPDLRATAGYQDQHGRVGTELSNEDDTWGLDVFGRSGISEQGKDLDGLSLFPQEVTLGGPDQGWFGGVQLRIPVFEGRARTGRRIQNRAFLQSLKAALTDAKDLIELRVRQSYRLLAEQQFQVQLAQENVQIERERFSIQEQLHEAGRSDDDALERFRENFFRAQDLLFVQQERLIERQEDLRAAIRLFR